MLADQVTTQLNPAPPFPNGAAYGTRQRFGTRRGGNGHRHVELVDQFVHHTDARTDHRHPRGPGFDNRQAEAFRFLTGIRG
jgi:hypothetical protein